MWRRSSERLLGRRSGRTGRLRRLRGDQVGINGWSEALRVELQPDVRVIVIEPGATATELPDHITHAASKRVSKALDWSVPPHDIADVIAFAVSRPQRVTLNEILVRPTVQTM
jgi:NADP-dependent 3-hydroxy acid dehydrogenase YdfG